MEISFDWNKSIEQLPNNGKRNMDIFFQPSISWSNGTLKMIALLFIEDDPGKIGGGGDDFQQLVIGLMKWVLDEAKRVGPTGRRKNLSYYEELYHSFLARPFEYEQLNNFLKSTYTFQIQEYVHTEGSEDLLNATVFPFFPDLAIKPGNAPSTKELEINQALVKKHLSKPTARTYSGQNTPNNHLPDTGDSARMFIFEDYANLIVRTAIQELIDTHYDADDPAKQAENELTHEAFIQPLFLDEDDEIDQGLSLIDNLAGIASAFVLYGLRLPYRAAQVKSIFEFTGQLFELESAKIAANKYQVKLSANAGDASYISFH
ncbi:MAG: hypothetical protein AAF696_13720, partial [Bacteroidota bacterium]